MPDEARIPTKRAADAIGMPEATLRLWLRGSRHEMTSAGYPIDTILRILTEKGRPVPRATLEGAAATRPRRRHTIDAPPDAPITSQAPDALATFLDILRTQQDTQKRLLATNEAILAELRELRVRAQPSQRAVGPWWLRVLRRILRA